MKAKARETGAVQQLTLRIPVELHRALKVSAAREGRTVAAIVAALIESYLSVGAKRGRARK